MSRPPAAAASFDRFLARLEAGMAAPAPHADGESASGSDLPDWLWQVVAVLYDGQHAAVSKDWARRLHGDLERLGGAVPFAVVHDWHAHDVAPMLAEASARRGWSEEPQQAVRRLHTRALAGEQIDEAEWNAVLEPVLREAYHLAYAYADAFANAYAGAHEYAIGNDYGQERAAEFAGTYAELNTSANAASFADSNGIASAAATAAAFAAADAHGYAEACPFAHVQVYAHACADQDRTAAQQQRAAQDERLRTTYRRLAEGLADSLARAAS
jgi:hypothetical protein